MNIIKTSSLRSKYSTIVGFKRFLTTEAPQVSDLAKILVIPITQDKSYIHFKYNDELINNNSLIVKYENKLTTQASNGWKKLKESDKSYNKKIVHYVEKFLKRTPWIENSLNSIPSKSSLLRQVSHKQQEIEESTTGEKSKDGAKKAMETITSLTSINDLNKDYQLLSIPVYYPGSLLSAPQLKTELLAMAQNGQKYHKKLMLWNGIGVPLTIPFIIVPIVPNIPGFYLAYRFYCNFKAYLGAEHLEQIAIREDLSFQDHVELDRAFSHHNPNSQLLLNEEIIDDITKTFGIEDVKSHLLKALKQEREALSNVD